MTIISPPPSRLVGHVLKFLKRARIRRPSAVEQNQLFRKKPLSNDFGFDRGLPLDRFFIERFLDANKDCIKGHVLEVKDGDYTRRFGGGRVTRSSVVDIDPNNGRATITADLNHIDSLPIETYDCVVITQTLQYVFELQNAIQCLYNSLKPGGILLVTVPGITRIEYELLGHVWFWSFTESSARRLFQPLFLNCEIESWGSLPVATSSLHGLAVEDLNGVDLLEKDLDFPVVTTVRAQKPKKED